MQYWISNVLPAPQFTSVLKMRLERGEFFLPTDGRSSLHIAENVSLPEDCKNIAAADECYILYSGTNIRPFNYQDRKFLAQSSNERVSCNSVMTICDVVL
jgi:hypothetical protein